MTNSIKPVCYLIDVSSSILFAPPWPPGLPARPPGPGSHPGRRESGTCRPGHITLYYTLCYTLDDIWGVPPTRSCRPLPAPTLTRCSLSVASRQFPNSSLHSAFRQAGRESATTRSVRDRGRDTPFLWQMENSRGKSN